MFICVYEKNKQFSRKVYMCRLIIFNPPCTQYTGKTVNNATRVTATGYNIKKALWKTKKKAKDALVFVYHGPLKTENSS